MALLQIPPTNSLFGLGWVPSVPAGPLPIPALGYSPSFTRPKWIAVRQRFTQFHTRLQLTWPQQLDAATKRSSVTKCLMKYNTPPGTAPATARHAPSPARAGSASNAPRASPPAPPSGPGPAPAASLRTGPAPMLAALPAAGPTPHSRGSHKHISRVQRFMQVFRSPFPALSTSSIHGPLERLHTVEIRDQSGRM